jgi:hypothetical protein
MFVVTACKSSINLFTNPDSLDSFPYMWKHSIELTPCYWDGILLILCNISSAIFVWNIYGNKRQRTVTVFVSYLNLRSRIIPEKVIVRNLLALCETRRCLILFRRVRRYTPSWVRWKFSIYIKCTPLITILILSYHIRLIILSTLFLTFFIALNSSCAWLCSFTLVRRILTGPHFRKKY